jgi:excisionase family DNA binding protein
MATNTTEATSVEKGWLTPEQAVEYSGIGRTRLYRFLTTGELRSAKLGKTRHIRRSDLDEFLESRKLS